MRKLIDYLAPFLPLKDDFAQVFLERINHLLEYYVDESAVYVGVNTISTGEFILRFDNQNDDGSFVFIVVMQHKIEITTDYFYYFYYYEFDQNGGYDAAIELLNEVLLGRFKYVIYTKNKIFFRQIIFNNHSRFNRNSIVHPLYYFYYKVLKRSEYQVIEEPPFVPLHHSVAPF